MAKSKLPWNIKFINKIKDVFFSFRKQLSLKKVLLFVDKRPFTSFFIVLGALLLLIILGNLVSGISKKEPEKSNLIKQVRVYRIGSSPKITLQGQVEKSGIFKIVAQTSGIVKSINYNEGDKISTGQPIINLSSNYQGGNIPGLQASIAKKQYQNILDTYETQKSIIEDQKKIATYSDENTSKLRDISRQNLDDANSLINLNEDILNTLNSQLNTLESTNIGGINDAGILQTKQLIAQLKSGLLQLRASSRNFSLQTDTANPPAQLSEFTKEIALKQTDIQLKALDLNKEISRIQTAIAGIAASFMNPTSPGNGLIDRIYVRVGDMVNPGTSLALISGNKKETSVVVRVPYDIASNISLKEPTTIYTENDSFDALPSYVSTEATDGQLYSVIYPIKSDIKDNIVNGSYIRVDIPIEFTNTVSTTPYIPLDAIYQTQNEAYVLVSQNNKAADKKVILGTVYGRFVQVLSGLNNHDRLILNRNIIAGDNIEEIN